ncbi:ankyrin repeat-containing protein BDA1-like [Salvia miltiorrhiza]|uniref:ankyrin repeat-containing protein BDA1-like n=1 Tax=Salvia miltiorrhiza TaxID=226208 RepID=UPI0025AB8BE4|nr:ankyrin repeat-containing protein BDA1-like [Salvia miltiorrhiza]
MERKLVEAAVKGDVQQLQNLIKDDPLLLSAAALGGGDAPLHIACIGSHLEFVKELLLHLGAESAAELNQEGLSPLHIASARGDVEIVKELLKLGGHLCLAKGRESRIPLHSAVAKGRTRVIAELLSACEGSIAHATARGETCFHLAVKFNQYEAFKVLCDHAVSFGMEEVLNSKDGRGNTVLHIAASKKQYEVFDLLLEKNPYMKNKLEVKSLNNKRRTPFDVLISEGGDCDIEEILTRAAPPTQTIPAGEEQSPEQQQRRRRPRSASQKLQDYFKYDKTKESPGKARNTLLIIAVLIVTATYQAVLSPPGGVWEADGGGGGGGKRHSAGQSVMGTNKYVSYGLFLVFNSMGFFMSVHLIHFLTSGLPLQFEIRVALFALTATYDTCMVAIAPPGILSTFFIALSVMMPIIIALLTYLIRDFTTFVS